MRIRSLYRYVNLQELTIQTEEMSFSIQICESTLFYNTNMWDLVLYTDMWIYKNLHYKQRRCRSLYRYVNLQELTIQTEEMTFSIQICESTIFYNTNMWDLVLYRDMWIYKNLQYKQRRCRSLYRYVNQQYFTIQTCEISFSIQICESTRTYTTNRGDVVLYTDMWINTILQYKHVRSCSL